MIKSSLNPHATPFVPSYLRAPIADSGEDSKVEKAQSAKFTDHKRTDVQNGVVIPESSDDHQYLYYPGEMQSLAASIASQHALESGKQSAVLDFNSVAGIFLSEFPNVSLETLAELYFVNGGDVEETLNMLEQLEVPLDEADIPGASNANSIEPKPREVGEPSGSAMSNEPVVNCSSIVVISSSMP